jgi:hypothetical protein
MSPAAADGAFPGSRDRDPTGFTSPTRARELFDQLEAKIGALPDGHGAGLHGDFVRDVPGAAEPPD